MLKSEAFQSCSHEVLCQILSRDTLHAPEIEIFRSVVVWAEKELGRNGKDVDPASIRSTLGGALDLIRFSQMDAVEFATGVAKSGVLTPEKVNDVFMWFTTGERSAWFKANRKGLYLQCRGDGSNDSWTYKAEINLRVANYRQPTSDIVKRTEVRTFNKETFDWGFNHMADISNLLDESKGFLQNDTVVFSADVFPQ
ncbi:bpb/poz domain-containing protein [Aphelenchoides avenae]|nr:bpb/poz domain-containing protein [Aphelenchus avenae]